MVDALNYTAITWLQTALTNTGVVLDSFVISCQSKVLLPFCCICVSCETSLKMRLFRRPLKIAYIPSCELKMILAEITSNI